jgi:hypothetical protein
MAELLHHEFRITDTDGNETRWYRPERIHYLGDRMYNVVIKRNWLGGNGTDEYRCDDYHVKEGVLWLTQRMHSSEPVIGIPVVSISEIRMSGQ